MNIAEILNKHVAEDGTLNVAEAEKELKAEVAKEYVPKHDFNSKNDQLKTANDTIATLQKDNKGNEELQTQITKYKEEAEKAESELTALQIRKEAEDALRDKGVTNIDYAMYKIGELERSTDGTLKDFEAKYTEFAKANPDFIKSDEPPKEEEKTQQFFGVKPTEKTNNAGPTLSPAALLGQQKKAQMEATQAKAWGEY